MKEAIVRWFFGGIVREIAEGKRGEKPKMIYWWLSGKKTTTSAVVGLAFAAFAAIKPQEALAWAPTVTFVLGLMVAIGLADKDWKNAPPTTDWKVYLSSVLSAGPAIAAACALVANLLTSIGCAVCLEYVGYVNWFAAAFASATGWLAARWNLPPAFPMRRSVDVGIATK